MTPPLPDAMLAAVRWIEWRKVPDREDPTKTNKIPIDPFTHQPFEEGSGWQTDPARWTRVDRLNGQPKGFTLGDGWAGLDLDDCIVHGTVAPWAQALVRALGTYAEISPSGTGIKIFMRGTRPEGAKTSKTCDAWNVEIYSEKRYFTVTGNKLPDAPNVIRDLTGQLQKITDVVFGEDLIGLCRLRDLIIRETTTDVHIRCPWASAHTHGNGDTDAALQVKDGQVVGFHCFHSHCDERTLRDVRAWFGLSGGLDHPLTEAGDAECFADLYQDRVRYDHRRGRWLVSDEASGIWVPDPVEQLTQMTLSMARDRQRQAAAIEEAARKKAAFLWAIKGEGRGRLTNALALARSVPPLADTGEHWDEAPFLLGTQNGVVDLRTGTFRKATPGDRLTMRVRVAYDPAATCPLWVRTLAGIFAPADTSLLNLEGRAESQRLIDFLQRAIGYSSTGDCREECCFFAWGDGANGKSTVMHTLGWLFGDYTDDMPYSTLERSERGSGIPNDVAKMAGKRFITCAEVNEFNLNEARLKALTGRDAISARFLNKEFFTFIPVCKIWIATNNRPKIVGQDDGIWRRIHLIPFTQKFEGRENKELKDQLRGELPGILNWIIAGAGLWLRDGLNPPDTVKAATAAYRQESNPITPFVDACCERGETRRMQAADAFKAYETFCRAGGIDGWQRLTNKAFFKAMGQAFTADKTGRQVFYRGVGLTTTAAPPADAQPVDDSMAANPEPPDEVPDLPVDEVPF